MLQPGQQLRTALSPYLQDMERCRAAGAHWCLLHVVLCLPDICAALESPSGEAEGRRYVDWCDKYLRCPALAGIEVYGMRCKVLHQGRARTDKRGRYEAFAFGAPTDGVVDHLRPEGRLIHVDVEELMTNVLSAIERWSAELESDPLSVNAVNVGKNLASLVRITAHSVPRRIGQMTAGQSLGVFMNKTH